MSLLKIKSFRSSIFYFYNLTSRMSTGSVKKEEFVEVDLGAVKEQFRALEGGQITCRRDEKSGLAYVCIDHEEKKNGMSGKMMVDLNEIVTKLEDWKNGKGLILYGKGSNFCSGGYLDSVKKIFNPADGFKMSCLMHDTVIKLRNLPLLSLSLVHGKAIGGGAELLLATDFRVLTQSAEIAFVEAIMGVGTGWGGGTLLNQLLGRQKALDLLLTARKILPEEALWIGLTDHIITEEKDTEKILEEATEWLNLRVSHLSPEVSRTVKSIVNCGSFADERRIFARVWGGRDHTEALNKNIRHK